MPHWAVLDQELSRWSASGRVATLWWRDDDAVAPSPALDTLLELCSRFQVGVALAVIPAGAQPALARSIDHNPRVTVVQHGFAHVNHEPAGAKASEFGERRDLDVVRRELADGLARLRGLFRERLLPAFVPPWNRIGERATDLLPTLGLLALSTYRPRTGSSPREGLLQVNCHADLMDWRDTRGFIGTAKVVADIVEHLAARREAAVDADEPTGILTHHLAHDQACWRFLRALFERTRSHSSVRWLDAGEALCPSR